MIDKETPIRSELLARIAELEAENAFLRARIAEIEQQLSKLIDFHDSTITSVPSPSVPAFVKPKHQKKRHKKPGQKPGHTGSYRQRPTQADEIIEVKLEDCPHCHSALNGMKTCEQYVEEVIPAHTIVICYRTYKGYCPNCQRTVQSRHPDQIPNRMIGSRALLLAADMKHGLGVPYRKVATSLKRLCGLSITAGALTQEMSALAKWLKPEYEAIQSAMRQSPSVNIDETGWRLDGESCWLWAFTNDSFTIYEVNPSRGHQVVLEQLGEDYCCSSVSRRNDSGTIISDFYTAYNPLPYKQQKCLVHLLRELSQSKNDTDEFMAFRKKLTRLLRDALRLKQRMTDTLTGLPQETYDRLLGRIHNRLSELCCVSYQTGDCQRLSKRLSKHSHQLFTFLEEMDVDSNNNRAERAIRPAVVTRKISGGNRSSFGTSALSIITSIIQTCKQQGKDFVEVGMEIIRRYHANLPTGILLTNATPVPT
jgi:transposase